MEQLHLVDHPLVEHHLTSLRDRETDAAAFRAAARRLTTLMAFEATRSITVRACRVETPMGEAKGARVAPRIGLVPVLRAGLIMVDPLLELIPEAEVWHLGVFRDESTATPVNYYDKLPVGRPVDVALVLDPMLATGGTVGMVIERLKHWGAGRVELLTLLSAPEGLREVTTRFPDVPVHSCAVDNHLNARKYIVPGLGDAGDRAFGTVSRES